MAFLVWMYCGTTTDALKIARHPFWDLFSHNGRGRLSRGQGHQKALVLDLPTFVTGGPGCDSKFCTLILTLVFLEYLGRIQRYLKVNPSFPQELPVDWH